MQKAEVYYNNILAGYITKSEGTYSFKYTEEYRKDERYPAISLSLPKQKDIFLSDNLFPFFYGLLSEGDNKDILCRKLKIDENDHFTLLIKTANLDTIGAITVREI